MVWVPSRPGATSKVEPRRVRMSLSSLGGGQSGLLAMESVMNLNNPKEREMRKNLKSGEAVTISAQKVWVTQPKKDADSMPTATTWSAGDFLTGVLLGIVVAILRMAA